MAAAARIMALMGAMGAMHSMRECADWWKELGAWSVEYLHKLRARRLLA